MSPANVPFVRSAAGWDGWPAQGPGTGMQAQPGRFSVRRPDESTPTWRCAGRWCHRMVAEGSRRGAGIGEILRKHAGAAGHYGYSEPGRPAGLLVSNVQIAELFGNTRAGSREIRATESTKHGYR